MRFEKIVDELYERYVRAVEKEEKMKRIEEKAKELGFEAVEVEFNEKTATAKATIEIENKKLKEVAEWLVGTEFSVYKIKVLITTTEIKQEKTSEGTLERASEIGLNYIKYEQIYGEDYIDFFEIERDDEKEIYVYLAIYNYDN